MSNMEPTDPFNEYYPTDGVGTGAGGGLLGAGEAPLPPAIGSEAGATTTHPSTNPNATIYSSYSIEGIKNGTTTIELTSASTTNYLSKKKNNRCK